MSADDSTHAPTDAVVGGGLKKVLYTLRSAQRIGVARAAKALTSHNACKVCGLGMGGQLGGMTNELGEFPSVCNKSVQAQITDIQPPIPDAIFDHPLSELQELDGHELEHLGRLNTPLYKSATSDRYEAIDWARALELASRRLRETRAERSFFYASGRSSNEAGFILQLFARALGTNNVNNCSYYCHQATSVALEHSIGTGTATVELADLGSCDLIFVIGANPASNHPRFIHQLKACRERGGHVVIINPAREPGLVRFAVPKSANSSSPNTQKTSRLSRAISGRPAGRPSPRTAVWTARTSNRLPISTGARNLRYSHGAWDSHIICTVSATSNSLPTWHFCAA
jgi:anaerobic selenocysteine-containing dehydrogenase